MENAAGTTTSGVPEEGEELQSLRQVWEELEAALQSEVE